MSETTDRTTDTATVWPCLNYRDAGAAIAFLTGAFGFVETIVVTADGGAVVAGDDRATANAPTDVVEHAELRWPEGGGVMLGTAGREGSEFAQMPTGASSVYVVTADPHGVFARAAAAGVRIVRGMRDEDYGSTGFTAADPEGNLWSFGTYGGEPLPG